MTTKQITQYLRQQDYTSYRYGDDAERKRRQEERDRYAARHAKQAVRMSLLGGK